MYKRCCLCLNFTIYITSVKLIDKTIDIQNYMDKMYTQM